MPQAIPFAKITIEDCQYAGRLADAMQKPVYMFRDPKGDIFSLPCDTPVPASWELISCQGPACRETDLPYNPIRY